MPFLNVERDTGEERHVAVRFEQMMSVDDAYKLLDLKHAGSLSDAQ